MSTLLSQEWAERYAREAAYAFGTAGAHDYLPKTAAQAARWLPHQWVIEAIRTAFGKGLRGRADTNFLILENPPAPEVYAPGADEDDAVALWAEIHRLRAALQGPDGYATWQEAATAERVRRVRAEKARGEPVAWVRWEWNRTGAKSLVFEKPDQLSLSEEARGVVYDPLYS